MGGGGSQKTNIGGDCLKREDLGSLSIYEGFDKKEGVLFLMGGRVDTLMHTMLQNW